MAQEAILAYRQADPVDFIVADGIGITKGALLQLIDPMTASGASAAAQMLAGIAARDKVAGDGRTRLAVFQKGKFLMYASGAIPAGAWVMSDGASNYIRVATGADTASGAILLGRAEETASTGEQVMIAVSVG